MTHEMKMELERLVKAAQREALTDAFNMLIDKSNRIDKVLFNPTGEWIKDNCLDAKYDRMAELWHILLQKSIAYTTAASAMIELKQNYF